MLESKPALTSVPPLTVVAPVTFDVLARLAVPPEIVNGPLIRLAEIKLPESRLAVPVSEPADCTFAVPPLTERLAASGELKLKVPPFKFRLAKSKVPPVAI